MAGEPAERRARGTWRVVGGARAPFHPPPSRSRDDATKENLGPTHARARALAPHPFRARACMGLDHGKWGVSVGGPYGESVQLLMDATPISWLYNYNVQPEAYVFGEWVSQSNSSRLADWLNANSIEYVPMLASRSFFPMSGPADASGLCWLVVDESPAVMAGRIRCSASQIAEVLLDVKKRMAVPVRYLLTMNEPWFMRDIMDPLEAVEIWRLYVQPAARAAELLLVSPSVNVGHVEWVSDFLRLCHERRELSPACDVESVNAFAVHEYSCKETFWRAQYESQGFREAILDDLGESRSDSWRTYLRGRRFWVTETNCNWENGDRSSDMPNPEETCRRASGGAPSTHGRGSIVTMNGLSDVERYAWWTVSVKAEPGTRHYNSRMADARGCLLGPGKALYMINAGQSSIPCSSAAYCPPVPNGIPSSPPTPFRHPPAPVAPPASPVSVLTPTRPVSPTPRPPLDLHPSSPSPAPRSTIESPPTPPSPPSRWSPSPTRSPVISNESISTAPALPFSEMAIGGAILAAAPFLALAGVALLFLMMKRMHKPLCAEQSAQQRDTDDAAAHPNRAAANESAFKGTPRRMRIRTQPQQAKHRMLSTTEEEDVDEPGLNNGQSARCGSKE